MIDGRVQHPRLRWPEHIRRCRSEVRGTPSAFTAVNQNGENTSEHQSTHGLGGQVNERSYSAHAACTLEARGSATRIDHERLFLQPMCSATRNVLSSHHAIISFVPSVAAGSLRPPAGFSIPHKKAPPQMMKEGSNETVCAYRL